MKNEYCSKPNSLVNFLFITFMIILIAKLGYRYYCGGSFHWILIEFIWMSVAGLFAFPIFHILGRVFSVSISVNGLMGYNAYSWFIVIAWENMVKVQPINLFGVKYLRVFSKSGKSTIWILMPLKDGDGFLESIRACGGDRDLFSPYFVQDP